MNQQIASHKLDKWSNWAMEEGAEQLLKRIYSSPLMETFHNRAGITVQFNAFEYRHFFTIDGSNKLNNFFRCYELAKTLEAKGLAKIHILGTHTFSITTLKEKSS